ncbi:LysM peptidoglycan-binding domain-containing protein [Paenibacillus sp. CMAA1364]
MKIHMVKKGDTLYNISGKYGIPLEKLIVANPQLADPNKLNIGDKVKIPSKSVVTPPKPEDTIHRHVVKQGDSLWKISKAWGVSLKEMIDANPQLKNPNALLVGEVVNIPKTIMSEGVHNGTSQGGSMKDKVMHGGKENTAIKPEMVPNQPAPPVIPQLPQIPVGVTPNLPAPNPIFNSFSEKVEMSQHLYVQIPVPAKEVIAEVPKSDEKQYCPVQSDEKGYPGIMGGYSYVQPQFEQPCYAEMMQNTEGMSECCYPQMSPYGNMFAPNHSGYSSYGGYAENSNASVSNMISTQENGPITYANIYSCTHPYEWTFPQANMPLDNCDMNPVKMAEAHVQENCGCHARDNSEITAVLEDATIFNEQQPVKTSSTSKSKKDVAIQSTKVSRNKEKKKTTVQYKRRNPWINS